MIFNEWLKLKEETYINPATNKIYSSREKFDLLKRIIKEELKKGNKSSQIWVHYSSIPKLGINPSSSWAGTPHGIYAYPINFILDQNYNEFETYAAQRRYMIVFRSKTKNIYKATHDETKEITKENGKLSSEETPFTDNEINTIIDKIYAKYKLIEKEKTGIKVFIKELFTQANQPKTSINEKFQIISTYGTKDRLFNLAQSKLSDILYKLAGLRYGSIKIFNIDPVNLTSELPPDTIKEMPHTINHINEKYKINLQKKINIKEMIEVFCLMEGSGILRQKYEEYLYLEKTYKEIDENVVLEIIEISKKILHEYAENYYNKYNNFNHSEKIKEICKENNINYKEVVYNYANITKINSPNYIGFVYKFTKHIAQKICEKQNKINSLAIMWNYILRKIGIEGISDRLGTKTIYRSEPIQGVFFSIKNLEIISIIDNQINDKPLPLHGAKTYAVYEKTIRLINYLSRFIYIITTQNNQNNKTIQRNKGYLDYYFNNIFNQIKIQQDNQIEAKMRDFLWQIRNMLGKDDNNKLYDEIIKKYAENIKNLIKHEETPW